MSKDRQKQGSMGAHRRKRLPSAAEMDIRESFIDRVSFVVIFEGQVQHAQKAMSIQTSKKSESMVRSWESSGEVVWFGSRNQHCGS